MKIKRTATTLVFLLLLTGVTFSQLSIGELKLKSEDNAGLNLSSIEPKSNSKSFDLSQKPTKKIYFVLGGKIGMFFLQGDFKSNQLIALELFGRYIGEGFWAEISLPFRFKTSPAMTDFGLDVNILYPFLGSSNKSEVDPFVGGGLGLHFVGMDKEDTEGSSITARGGLGLNLIAGAVFFKNYDFNIVLELKYFNYLREFDDRRYQVSD